MPVVTLEAVKLALNIDASNIDDDAELQTMIDGATAVIEGLVGPVVSAEKDEWYDGGRERIFFRSYPVISVTTVTEYSPTEQVIAYEPFGTDPFTSFGYRIDRGSLIRTAMGSPSTFACGSANVHVVYVAGRTTVPANVASALTDLIRINWQPQQAGNLPGIGSAEDTADAGQEMLGFYVPDKILEQISSERRVLM